jgi:hypothetical protein
MLQDKDVITGRKGSRNRTVRAVWADWVAWVEESGFRKSGLVCICFFCVLLQIQAQYIPLNMPLNPGEEVKYDVYFKWGILMPRAGEARFSFSESDWQGQPASHYRMIFHTANIFESIYKMRDTINCYYGLDNKLLYGVKHTVESGYDLTDKLTFSYTGDKTSVYSLRYTPTATKIDTTLTVDSGHVFDMLGATFFLRTLDRTAIQTGDVFVCTVITGKDLIRTSFRYQGQAIVERDRFKYRTHYYIIDIQDDAFSQSKASAELWIGDDDNYIPIKVRTKLKIGYAEVYCKSVDNLKKPFDCCVEVKR